MWTHASIYFEMILVILIGAFSGSGRYTLEMIWRDSLKENPCFVRVNVVFNPFGPCFQAFLVCNQAIHVLVRMISFSNEIPSAEREEWIVPNMMLSMHVIIIGILRTVVFFQCEATNAKSRILVYHFLSTFCHLQLNPISGLYQCFHLQYPPKMRYGKASPSHHSSAYIIYVTFKQWVMGYLTEKCQRFGSNPLKFNF